MKHLLVVVVLSLLAFMPGRVSADTGMPVERHPLPGASLTAAAANLFYVPVRFAVTLVSAELGGLTGFLTGGNKHAAEDVWGVFEGQAILTRDAVQGIEPVRFGNLEYRLLLIDPGY
jgi:hypothetical protein